MGTINYKTSDYITMGARIQNYSDFENDSYFLEEMKEEIDRCGLENVIYSEIEENYNCDRLNVETYLNQHNFYFYHVTIEPGYYEGFSINIENNFPIAYNDREEKRQAQKEITELKQFLLDCAGAGIAVVYPGWCTTELSYNDSVKAIKAAIKEIREESKAIPTWLWYEREQYFARRYTAQ